MSNRSVRDGIILVGGFHFFMAILSLVAVAAIFVYTVLPPTESGTTRVAQDLFLPVLGMILGLIICGVYIIVGWGLIQLKNISRMISIFLAAIGIFGGFIGVIGSISTNVAGQAEPAWFSIIIVSMATICGYTLIGFMNIFLLIFLFHSRVRSLFYTEEWTPHQDDYTGNEPPQLEINDDDDSKPIKSLADLG
ncbi:MAG: hypothetical protein MUO76_02360 [Anaerolineaceae bacterium]|nr:hypothetical protein [Anaerolineaceae bacterium]